MASALKDYLQRYVGSGGSDGGDTGKAKERKKKKRKGKHGGGAAAGNGGNKGVVIVDDDALWQKEEKAEDEAEPDEEGDEPMVIEDVEVKRMQRMEAMKMHRPYLSMANDGSGWVTVREDASGAAPPGGAGRRGEYDSDDSRPRSPRGKSPDVSVKRKRNDSPDLSPQIRRHDSPDVVPGRRLASEDFSSPRKSKNFTGAPKEESPELTPPRKRRDSPDLSPPRRRHDSPVNSPTRRLDSDHLSPPRKSEFVPAARNRNQAQDLSPPRKRRDSRDLSPPRRRQDSSDISLGGKASDDLSPPRKRRDSRDLSPPRRRQDSSDISLARKVSDDLSPPRRSKFSTGDHKESRESLYPRKIRDPADLSSRRQRHDSPEMSPMKRVISEDSDLPRRSKTSTAARYRNESQDLSPPRARRASSDVASLRRVVSKDSSPLRRSTSSMAATNLNEANEAQDLSPPRKKVSGRMGDGALAGLKSDREVVSEAERKRAAEAKFLAELDPSLSGRGAETVFRDKRGRRLEGLEEMLRQQKGAAKPVEQPLEWGKGLAQKKVADASLAELEAEKSKPFARYRDDTELDKALKDRVRFGDPMAHLVKKKIVDPVLEDLGASEEMKASGFIIPQDIPKHSWLKAGRAPPPNRYDIRPGRHWDGVDRSTGYEQGLFKQRNEKKAREQEAYLWSVADM